MVTFLLRGGGAGAYLAAATGALAGLATTGLIVVVNETLGHRAAKGTATAAFIAGCVVLLVGTLVSQLLLLRFSQRRTLGLRVDLSRRILAAPLRELERIGPSRLMAVLTEDVLAIGSAATFVPGLLTNAAVLFACFAFFGWLSLELLGFALVFVVVGVASFQILAAMAMRSQRLARTEQDALLESFRGMTEGTKELLLGRDRRSEFLSDLAGSAERLSDRTKAAHTLASVANAWGGSLLFIGIGLVLFLSDRLSVGEQARSGYALTALYMIQPIAQMLMTIPIIARASVSLKNIEALDLALPGERAGVAHVAEERAPDRFRELRLTSIRVTNDRGDGGPPFSLGPLDVTIKPGRVLFIVGGNGSGKSTLAKLLSGLYPPESGTISIDGIEIGESRRDWYRQHFAAVFADAFVFDKLYGVSSEKLSSEAARYLARVEMDHVVTIRDGRFSTTRLSQGQRKRLALVAAYLEDRPICIFDEWPADQDPRFKQLFYLEILPELRSQGKAVIVVSHDDRYFHCADELLRLEDGQLVDGERRAPIDVAREEHEGARP
jgi:putative ATP-binding cassette transporter